MAADLSARAALGRLALVACYGSEPRAFLEDEAAGWPALDAFGLTAAMGRAAVADCIRLYLGLSDALDDDPRKLGRLLGHLHQRDAEPVLACWLLRRVRREGAALASRGRSDPQVLALKAGYAETAWVDGALRRGAWRDPDAPVRRLLEAVAVRLHGGWALSEGIDDTLLSRVYRIDRGQAADLAQFVAFAATSPLDGFKLLAAWYGRDEEEARPQPEALPPVEPLPRRVWTLRQQVDALRSALGALVEDLSDGGRHLAVARVRLAMRMLGGVDWALRGAGARASGRWVEAAAPALLTLLVVLGGGCPVEPVAETDTDDTDCTLATFHPDADGDGYGDSSVEVEACEAPDDHVADGTDCDDGDAATHPGAEESCTEAVDRNCDGSVRYADDDGDGTPACEDCDDGDATVYPGAEESCDGVDEDCDGTFDEGVVPVWYVDEDGGTASPSGSARRRTPHWSLTTATATTRTRGCTPTPRTSATTASTRTATGTGRTASWRGRSTWERRRSWWRGRRRWTGSAGRCGSPTWMGMGKTISWRRRCTTIAAARTAALCSCSTVPSRAQATLNTPT